MTMANKTFKYFNLVPWCWDSVKDFGEICWFKIPNAFNKSCNRCLRVPEISNLLELNGKKEDDLFLETNPPWLCCKVCLCQISHLKNCYNFGLRLVNWKDFHSEQCYGWVGFTSAMAASTSSWVARGILVVWYTTACQERIQKMIENLNTKHKRREMQKL